MTPCKPFLLSQLLLAGLAILFAQFVCAQDYPTHPVRLVVNFPAGGPVDINARALTAQLTSDLGWNFVIDIRSGANGGIGAELVAKSPPDGYTMLFAPSAIAVNQALSSKVTYDLLRDLIPVSNVAWAEGYLITVHPSVPARTLKEYIALANKKDTRINNGTAGIGNPSHLVGELFSQRTGIHVLNVPYQGLAPAVTALVGGEVDVVFVPPTAVLPYLKSGRLRALAYTGATRLAALPDVPTVMESGVPDFEMRAGWHGWFAPAKTPDRIVTRLAAEIAKAVQTPRLRQTFLAGGYEPVRSSPAEFYKFIDSEIKRFREVARIAKIKVD